MTPSLFLIKCYNKLKYYIGLCRKNLSNPSEYIDTKKFIRGMNCKSRCLKMKNSRFVNASGATGSSFSTAHDLTLLCKTAIKFDAILDMWQTNTKTIKIKGPNQRDVEVKNLVFERATKGMKKFLIGGKSGSWGSINRSHVFYVNVDGEYFIISIMSNDIVSFEKIYVIASELIQSISIHEYGYYTKNLIKCGGGFSVVNCKTNIAILQHEQNRKMIPASVTKVLTAICALESKVPLETVVKVSAFDILGGSGSNYYPNDELSLSDALYAMMMESSNTLANSIARTIGSNM